MTGDSENESGQSADETLPSAPGDSSPESRGEQGHARPRAFRSWAAAEREEKGPSVWSKLKQRISGTFSKKTTEITTPEEAAAYTAAAAEGLDKAAEEIAPSPISANDDAFFIPTEEPEAAPLAEPAASESEPIAAASDQVEVAPAEEVRETFASMEDALPADEPPMIEAALTAAPPVTPARKKGGLFGRLFGRKSKEDKAVEVVPTTDEHNVDIAAAAAEALDVVAESAFPPVEESPTLAGDSFAIEEPELTASAEPEPELISLPAETAPMDVSSDEPVMASIEEALPTDDLPMIETAPAEEVVEAPKKAGLFGRLFTRKSKEQKAIEALPKVDEHDVAAAAADALEVAADSTFPPAEAAPTFAGDAFDVVAPAEEPATMDATVDATTAPMDLPDLGGSATVPMDVSDLPREKRPSFIGRLFGQKAAAPRPSLEIEIHADRIEAAAAQAAEQPVMDDAAPVMEATQPVPVVDDMRFAPPPPPPAPASSDEWVFTNEMVEGSNAANEPTDSRPTMEVVPDNRPTLEVAADSRATMEVEQESRSTLEVSASDLPVPADVMEDKDTDEFEIVLPPPEPPATIPEPPAIASLDVDTAEVKKKSVLARLFGKRDKTTGGMAAGATVLEGSPQFLYSKFRAFYNEIIRFKHQKSEFSAGFSTAIVTDYTADLTPDAAAEAQSKKLAEMLELQTAEASWVGGEAAERYPDAKYAMAALADEIFTYMEWDGKDAWPRHLVEMRLYRTQAADVEVFKRMDKLLKDKPNTPVARDMARVYLLVLAAGFQGKYRPFELPRAIAQYRQRLFEFIHSEDPLMLYAPERRIFPETAERTLVGHAVARFSGAQRWAAILFFLVTAYTVIAHVAWNRVSADLKDVTQRIRSGSTTAGVR